MFSKTIIGKKDSRVKIVFDADDDIPPAELLQLIKNMQQFVDQFDSVEEFEAFMDEHTSNWQEVRVH